MIVLKKSYNVKPFDKKEILRYAACSGSTENIDSLLGECIKECSDVFTYNVCFCEVPIKTDGNVIDIGFAKIESTSLKKNLQGCNSAVLFAATVGLQIDRIIAKYSRISPAKAVIFQAIGAERIEALCDAFEGDMKRQYLSLKPRFSPGYGDFNIDTQRDVLDYLDSYRKVGISINDSFLMSPSKSVSAIIGIRRRV